MSVSRTDAPSLAETLNDTLPLPCPDVGDNPLIQSTDVDAVHAHSGWAVTENDPVPPPASTAGGVVSDNAHFPASAAVGLVITVEELSHPLTNTAATSTDAAATDGQRRATHARINAGLSSIAVVRFVRQPTAPLVHLGGASCIPALSVDVARRDRCTHSREPRDDGGYDINVRQHVRLGDVCTSHRARIARRDRSRERAADAL